jgi:hypothetical protein
MNHAAVAALAFDLATAPIELTTLVERLQAILPEFDSCQDEALVRLLATDFATVSQRVGENVLLQDAGPVWK